MKLRKVHVTQFRSIWDSNEFEIGDVTCLVGKNESGKTALLEALYRLNPIDDVSAGYDVTDDYPRFRVSDYEDDVSSGQCSPATVCRAVFELEDEDLRKLSDDYGEGLLPARDLTIFRGYDNKLRYSFRVDEAVLCENLVNRSQLPSELSASFADKENLAALSAELDSQNSEENSEHLARLRAEIQPFIDAENVAAHIYSNYIERHVPCFLYFSDYWLLKGQENVEALQSRQDNKQLEETDHPLLGLIALARLDIAALLQPDRTQDLKNRLEGAGNKLTRDVMKYWSQNKNLSTRFDIRPARPNDPEGMRKGTNFWADIYDSKHLATTPLGRRSKGFLWFFSFLAYFSQQKRKPQALILLLDEPGLSLHGTAQADLLRYIEAELKPEHQVIYTTHSPFLVDPQHFERVRIVQDIGADTDDGAPDEEGTKVISDVLEATRETLFPLQGALGYEIHQTLFVGPNLLIVEGPSDLLYLHAMSSILGRAGRTALDDAWTLAPVGGAGRVPAFVALLNSQKRTNVALLLDIDRENEQMLGDILKNKLLRKSQIQHVGQFCGKEQADIEDMFERDFYVSLVSEEFTTEPLKSLTPKKITSKAPRVIHAICQSLAIDYFNHYRPARYFVEKLHELEGKLSTETLNRFESLFESLNGMLKK